MSDHEHEGNKQVSADDDELQEAQEGKGYGEDEGEREESLPEE